MKSESEIGDLRLQKRLRFIANPGGLVTVLLRDAAIPAGDAGYRVPEACVVVSDAEFWGAVREMRDNQHGKGK